MYSGSLQAFKPVRRHATNLSPCRFGVGNVYLFPTIANADIELDHSVWNKTVELIIDSMQNETVDRRLPVAKDADSHGTFTIPLTAYTSDPAQTDDTPYITASDSTSVNGIENVVPANFLRSGAFAFKYSDRVFYVEDRMNERC